MRKILTIHILLFTVIFTTGCNIQNQSAKVTLTEDFDDKPLGQYNQSRWQLNSHTKTVFNTPNGGKYEYDCFYKRTMKGVYQSKNFIIPLIYRACREPIDRFKAPVVLYFHGGPYAYSVKNSSTIQDIFIKNGFTIVEPLYRGASERPWNFVKAWGAISTFADTRREVLELVDFYHRNGRNIIFAGDSFGGLIISSVFLNMKKSDFVVMFAPILSQVGKFIENQNKNIKVDAEGLIEINQFCKLAKTKQCGSPASLIHKNIFGSYSDFSPFAIIAVKS